MRFCSFASFLVFACVFACVPAKPHHADNRGNKAREDVDLVFGNRSKVSLAIAFDLTMTMKDVLNEMKAGLLEFMKELQSLQFAPFVSYVWTPFNDPVVGPTFFTENPVVFQKQVMNAEVYEIGYLRSALCAKKSFLSLEKAIAASLPNSYVFLFTSAPPLDVYRYDELLDLALRKRVTISIIRPEGCIKGGEANLPMYDSLAKVTGGHNIPVFPKDTTEFMTYAARELKPNRVSLATINRSNQHTLLLNVDSKIEVLWITISGTGLKSTIKAPDNSSAEPVINKSNFMATIVNKVKPGIWPITITAEGPFMLRINAEGKVNFRYGFSRSQATNLISTNLRPILGEPSNILIHISHPNLVENLLRLNLIDENGLLVGSLDLNPINKKEGTYRAINFEPADNGFFYLEIEGVFKNGEKFKRLSPTGNTAQMPAAPVLAMKRSTLMPFGARVNLKCHVTSLIPVNISWFKDGKPLKGYTKCRESCLAKYTIQKLTVNEVGTYMCRAKNSLGEVSQTNKVDLATAPILALPEIVYGDIGRTLQIKCNVNSRASYTMKWITSDGKDLPSNAVQDQNTLHITNITEENLKSYRCIATNVAGESFKDVEIKRAVPIEILIDSSQLSYGVGDCIRITCHVRGLPDPVIQWLKNDEPIEDRSVVIEQMEDGLSLVIRYGTVAHRGTYTCLAKNQYDMASSNVTLKYKVFSDPNQVTSC